MTQMRPVTVPEALCRRAQRTAEEFTAATGVPIDVTESILGRAALLGLRAAGQISAGGATRLVRCADSWCAITLARPDDVAAVPALVETDTVDVDPWPLVQRWVGAQPAAQVVARAGLLGIPAAAPAEMSAAGPRVVTHGHRRPPGRRPLVVDLSSMWAGPLCGQLLLRAGATVIKVESPRRPDGTRAGSSAFFDWMNGGKLCYSVDFDDRAALHRLLSAADVVIEGSRPAALQRRGIGPDDVAARAGRVWVRITGYGTGQGREHRVAFGDDAAVAGGLVRYGAAGPAFVGDAIADPLTGLHAAAAVVAALARGGGELIEMSMAATAAGYAGDLDGPQRQARAPQPGPRASEVGADNAAVLTLLDERHSPPC